MRRSAKHVWENKLSNVKFDPAAFKQVGVKVGLLILLYIAREFCKYNFSGGDKLNYKCGRVCHTQMIEDNHFQSNIYVVQKKITI